MTPSSDQVGDSFYPYVPGDPIPRPEAFEDNSAAAWDEWVQAGRMLEVALAKAPPPRSAAVTKGMPLAADDPVELASLDCHGATLRSQAALSQHATAIREKSLPATCGQRGSGASKFLQQLVGLGPDAARRTGRGTDAPEPSGGPKTRFTDRTGL